jgi:hypothetical protein
MTLYGRGSQAMKSKVEKVESAKDWISAKAASILLGISAFSVPKVAKIGGIRRKILPGLRPRYSRADVERVASESIEPIPKRASRAKSKVVSP